MNIKNIRQFRSFLKTDIRELTLDNRDEHFAGVRTEVDGRSQYGFFDFYHGYKEGANGKGIRGFLEGFLDMAKDGQAVYEFMQNAVDAGSSKFSLFWGKDEVDGQDYLLVANNGEAFTMEAVLSILNVGVSTKSEDNYTIGKFGIGFKLAHRLVGKENGLDELIDHNYGPILFSWKNGEVMSLPSLAVTPEITPVTQAYKIYSENGNKKAVVETDEPWLFKILVTNFPCQPENAVQPEIIRDTKYIEHQNVFSKSELQTMGRWVEKYKAFLQDDFQEGSLFFIRLGKGKQSSLEEENLEEGVRFSLAILNRIAQLSLGHPGLEEVNLNTSPIKPVDLQFESFVLEKGSEDFRKVRFGKTHDLTESEVDKENADSNIEILFGYTDHTLSRRVFTNAPNLYLFFPLSEEKHRLRFILHSNAFYKSSSRTYLQKGNLGEEGINERLFQVFAKCLKEKMLEWASAKDIESNSKFLEVYANLLLSNESDNPERVWINKPLWEPILAFLQGHIPLKSTWGNGVRLSHMAQSVKIKATALSIEQEDWLIQTIDWFHWDRKGNDELKTEAILKLGIEEYTIIDLLHVPGIYERINRWLDGNAANCELLLQEVETCLLLNPQTDDTFLENFSALQVWQFEDGYFTINQLAESGVYRERIFLSDKTDALKPFLEKAGFKLPTKSLSHYKLMFNFIQLKLQAKIKYIRNYAILVEVLSARFVHSTFTPAEKHEILKLLASNLRDSKEDRIEKLRELKLYANRLGEVVALKNLLKEAGWEWLSGWCVREEEYASELDEYITVSRDKLYEDIILCHWEAIMTQAVAAKGNYTIIFSDVKDLFQDTPKAATLSSRSILRLGHQFLKAEETTFYYSKTLLSFLEGEYKSLETVADKLGFGPIPSFELLPYYQESPFKLEEKNLDVTTPAEGVFVTADEAKALIKLCAAEDILLLNKNLLTTVPTGQELLLRDRPESCFQIATHDGSLVSYVQEYHKENLFPLPVQLLSVATPITHVKEDHLMRKLVDLCDYEDTVQLAALLNLCINGNSDIKTYLLQHLPKLSISLDKRIDVTSAAFLLVKLVLTLTEEEQKKEWLKKILVVEHEGQAYDLASLHLTGNDEVLFELESKAFKLSLSSILINEDAKSTRAISLLSEELAALEVAEKTALDRYFGLMGPVDKDYIFTTLHVSLENGLLKNASQLSFLLLYAKCYPAKLALSFYKVETKAGIVSLDNIALYAPDKPLPFLPSSVALLDAYAGVSSLLKLEVDKPFRLGSVQVLASPYLSGSDFHITGIATLDSLHAQEQLFLYLYKLWRQQDESAHNIYLTQNKVWEELIGFNPLLSVFAKAHVHPSETLPAHVLAWLEVQETSGGRDFLKALGVSFAGADIFKIRKYLTGDTPEEPANPHISHGQLILNSLQLLESSGTELAFGDRRATFLKSLFGKLQTIDMAQPLPLPVISPQTANTFSIKTVNSAFALEEAKLHKISDIQYPLQQLPIVADAPIVPLTLLDASFALKVAQKHHALAIDFDKIDEQTVAASTAEWERTFYTQWKENYPGHEIRVCIGGIPRIMQVNGRTCHHYVSGDVATIVDSGIILINSELNDKAVIRLIEQQQYFAPDALTALKLLFEQYEHNIHSYITQIQSDPNLKEEWKKLQEKAKEEAKKKQLAEEFGKAEKYSMAWFMNLLDLMVMAGGSGNSNDHEGRIVFSKLEPTSAGLKVISLKSPSTAISPNIELFTDFKATITYLDESHIQRSKKISIKGVSRKGQSVLALPTSEHELDGIQPAKVIKVEMSFQKVIDLLNRLTRAFRELGFENNYSLKKELSENINFIFGPPGTGKTTTISNLILNKIRGDEPKRILVLTPTNKAADVIVNRLREQSAEDDYVYSWLARFGFTTNTELLESGFVYDGNTFNYGSFTRCVVVTTIQRFPYEKVITGTNELGDEWTKLSDLPWDTIIFDEASMIMLPAIVYPMFKRKYKYDNQEALTEFIVGGDPLQLPPIFDIADEELPEEQKDVKEENIYTMVGLKSFSEDDQKLIPLYGENNQIKNLSTQYRSIEPIGTLFSKFKYGGLLSHGRAEGLGGSPIPRPLPKYFQDLGFKPITIIRYPVNTFDSLYNPQKLNNSPLQLYSAFLVNELIKRFKAEARDSEQWDLGVICPYRSQASLINKMVENHTVPNNNVSIITDTVHGFQGDQSDLVFAVFNPSSSRSQYSYFLKKDYILNVAVSRAKDYLILLLPDEKTEGIERLSLIHQNYSGSILNIIKSLPSESIATLNAGDLEAKLMNEQDYFIKNSFTNVHESVNIYGSPVMDYMVRLSGNAIDVHYKN
ncbi:AAA domain-containing protein [Pontibacter lucknowensis]|uniref:Superfamily I DNA and/or RNA helicase n=1 Tax=Pontibacter lucknowensis TaxID=1077936 RepID=A0A1N6TI43_9BACT|nr:AAA domain-containing protein [Pontibacter lucknowensis]SIQ53052.1 Superfamily I DNA and/or RNA helicase [Pontibacter lucknowensis]